MSQLSFPRYGVAEGLGFLDYRAVEEESEVIKGGTSRGQNTSVHPSLSDDERRGKGRPTLFLLPPPARSEPALPSLGGRITTWLSTWTLGSLTWYLLAV